MPRIIVDEEFKALLPALDKDTYAMLEENLLENGSYEKREPGAPTFSGPEKPIDAMLAAVYSLELAAKALSDTFTLLPEVKSAADRAELKKALQSHIDHLEVLKKKIP